MSVNRIDDSLIYIESRIERLEGDDPPLSNFDQHMAAWCQVRATTLLAQEVGRIGNLLVRLTQSFGPDDRTDENENSTLSLNTYQGL